MQSRKAAIIIHQLYSVTNYKSYKTCSEKLKWEARSSKHSSDMTEINTMPKLAPLDHG